MNQVGDKLVDAEVHKTDREINLHVLQNLSICYDEGCKMLQYEEAVDAAKKRGPRESVVRRYHCEACKGEGVVDGMTHVLVATGDGGPGGGRKFSTPGQTPACLLYTSPSPRD